MNPKRKRRANHTLRKQRPAEYRARFAKRTRRQSWWDRFNSWQWEMGHAAYVEKMEAGNARKAAENNNV